MQRPDQRRPPARAVAEPGGHRRDAARRRARQPQCRPSPSAFSINLASERVRRGLALLDGIRSGQSLGALLGYRFERGLHDAGRGARARALIFAFRRAFPLSAEKLAPTQNPPPPAIEAIEARNVVDGLALVKAAASTGHDGLSLREDAARPSAPAEQTAVEKAVTRSERTSSTRWPTSPWPRAVHQSAQGNPERVAAHLDVPGTFTAPPDPDVVRTPDSGFALTCRVGLELDAAATASRR